MMIFRIYQRFKIFISSNSLILPIAPIRVFSPSIYAEGIYFSDFLYSTSLSEESSLVADTNTLRLKKITNAFDILPFPPKIDNIISKSVLCQTDSISSTQEFNYALTISH